MGILFQVSAMEFNRSGERSLSEFMNKVCFRARLTRRSDMLHASAEEVKSTMITRICTGKKIGPGFRRIQATLGGSISGNCLGHISWQCECMEL